MRKFINAAEGFRDKKQEDWEQARLIAYYSAMPHMRKGFKLTDIPIPGEHKQAKKKAPQINKEDHYKILDKWNK